MSQCAYAAGHLDLIGGIVDSASGISPMTEGDFFWMPRRQVTVDDLPTLRDVREAIIEPIAGCAGVAAAMSGNCW